MRLSRPLRYNPPRAFISPPKGDAKPVVLPSPDVIACVERLIGGRAVAWTPVHGGYTPAGRWIVRFRDGASAFAKVGTTADTALWLRAEYRFYTQIVAPYLPALRGWEDGDEPILLLEDLSAAFWPPPWSRERVDRVLTMLAAVAATPPPPGLRPLTRTWDHLQGWISIGGDPTAFLSLGLCSSMWLDETLDILAGAEAPADLAGNSLLHNDVRSDNLCFAGERTLLVDWNWACRGNPRMDIAAWLPSLAAEGGPNPMTIMPDEPELAALLSGYFAARAGLPPPEGAPRVRAVQLSQLKSALPWAVASLGLPPLDGPNQ